MSFLSVEPQSRVILENYSNSLLTQFDTQLEIVADRYVAFFQERRRIEAIYIDSLRTLHSKTKTVDASFDPRAEPPMTRAAWDAVRDNLEREANAQQTFVDILDNDIIKPLTELKESSDKTRKRIEKDLKESAADYADFAENEISELQQAYFKKYHSRPHVRSEDLQEPEVAKSEEVFDDDCREAVSRLNDLRFMRAENLGDVYDCLEELVFTPIVKSVLVKYMDGIITACTKYDELAMSTKAEVEKTLAGPDSSDSDLRASFRRTLSFSIPPLTLYHNYRPGAHSDPHLIIGVPLLDLTTSECDVPKVMRMCIEEVEKRGLNINKIYLSGFSESRDAETLQLLRKFETEPSFSFSSTDDIHTVAALLMSYLFCLPEPLFMLSLQDYRNYRHNRSRYAEDGFSLLRSKIRELHPFHRASLEALLRHLLRVASCCGNGTTSVKEVAAHVCFAVLRGDFIWFGDLNNRKLVMEDLIQNAHTLFDERTFPSPHVPSPHVTEATSTFTYGSVLSHKSPQSTEAQAVDSTTRYLSTSTQTSFSSPSNAMESRLSSSPTAFNLLSPLPRLPSSRTHIEGAEITTQEQVIPEVKGAQAVETLANSKPADVVFVPPTSFAEWQLRVPQSPPHSGARTIPQSPPESVLSSASDFSFFSSQSSQT